MIDFKWDGLEECFDCKAEVAVFITGEDRRFIEHFVSFPNHCLGIPTQYGNGGERIKNYPDTEEE